MAHWRNSWKKKGSYGLTEEEFHLVEYLRLFKLCAILQIQRQVGKKQKWFMWKVEKGNEKLPYIIHKRFCKKQFVFRHQSIILVIEYNYVNFSIVGYLRGEE